MASSVECRITVSGENLDPDEFSTRVGLGATTTWRIGDMVGASTIPRKASGWQCSLSERNSLDAGELVEQLLDELEPHAELIASECVRLKLEVELACIIRVGQPTPALHLSREALARLSRLNAEIDLDIYLDSELFP